MRPFDLYDKLIRNGVVEGQCVTAVGLGDVFGPRLLCCAVNERDQGIAHRLILPVKYCSGH